MTWHFTPYSVPLIIGAVILFISALIVLSRSPTLTNIYMAIVNILIAICSGAYGIELGQTSLEGIYFWQKVGFLGGVTSPVFLLLLIIAYNGSERWLTGINHLILMAIPAVSIVFAWTNQLHGLIWDNPRMVKTGTLYVFEYEPGRWHWVAMIYTFIMIILSVAYLLSSFSRREGAFRKQVLLFLVGISIPTLAYGLFWVPVVTGVSLPKISWQAYGLIITGLMMTVSLHTYKVFQIGPVAYDAIFKNIEDMIVVLDGRNRVVDVNPAAINIFNWERPAIIGKNLLELLSSSEIEALQPYLNVSAAKGEIVLGDHHLDLKITSFTYQLQKSIGRLMVMRDITQRVEAEQHMEYLATHDTVTGLPNRAMFNEKLRSAIARAKRLEKVMVLLFIDIDNFKDVNDICSHAKGDWLLRDIATRLAGILRECDTVARWGGDEFAIILENVRNDEDIQPMIKRIQDVTKYQLDEGEYQLQVTTSIGVSIYPDHGRDANTLMKLADIAMHEAKKAGKNLFMFSREVDQSK